MKLGLRGCGPCGNDDFHLKDCNALVLKDVDYGDFFTFSVKFEGLNGDFGKCVDNLPCDTFTLNELKTGLK